MLTDRPRRRPPRRIPRRGGRRAGGPGGVPTTTRMAQCHRVRPGKARIVPGARSSRARHGRVCRGRDPRVGRGTPSAPCSRDPAAHRAAARRVWGGRDGCRPPRVLGAVPDGGPGAPRVTVEPRRAPGAYGAGSVTGEPGPAVRSAGGAGGPVQAHRPRPGVEAPGGGRGVPERAARRTGLGAGGPYPLAASSTTPRVRERRRLTPAADGVRAQDGRPRHTRRRTRIPYRRPKPFRPSTRPEAVARGTR